MAASQGVASGLTWTMAAGAVAMSGWVWVEWRTVGVPSKLKRCSTLVLTEAA